MSYAEGSLVAARRAQGREGLTASGNLGRPRLLGLAGWGKEVSVYAVRALGNH